MARGFEQAMELNKVENQRRVDLAENIVGPRGLEMQRTKVHTSPWNTSYPVYDGHGNMIATLTFNRPGLGTNGLHEVPTSYGVQLGNLRRYDVWGGVRGGQQTGYPNHRYCANLGHKVDDETGLIYMRARYYEPSTGRFISQDPAMDGRNWYVYCWNRPTMGNDPTGLLFMDLLMQGLDSVKNNVTYGNAARLGGEAGKDKLMEAVAFHFGRLVGICVALEIEYGRDGMMSLHGDDYRFRWNNADVQMHNSPTHVGYAHVDMRKALSKYEGWFKSQFGVKGIPLDAFSKGFWEGFW